MTTTSRTKGRQGGDILQVAKLARVSPSTVSRVANGSTLVNGEMTKRVWQAIKTLNYLPNPQARALVSGRSRTLGLLVSEITNPFFPELIQSFEEIAEKNGFEVMVSSTDHDKEHTDLFIRRLIQRRVEGVAVMTFRADLHLLKGLIAADIPIVSIDQSTSTSRLLTLEIDYAQGIGQAVDHLVGLGHEAIVFAGGPEPHSTNRLRKNAFREAIRKAGLRALPIPVYSDTFEGGIEAAKHFLGRSKPPTAILCSNDMMAVGVMRFLAQKKISVPEEVSVVGFDDIHLSRFMNPPLSTVSLPRVEIACGAFHALNLLREKCELIDRKLVRVTTSFVVRESTQAPARPAR